MASSSSAMIKKEYGKSGPHFRWFWVVGPGEVGDRKERKRQKNEREKAKASDVRG